MRQIIEDYYDILPAGGWPNFVFGNHDIHRFATRYGYENHRSIAMLLLTLWGIPTLYYGDELGMEDVFIPVAQRIDPWGINMPEGDFGRDPERTPMQWDASPNAGFTSGQPWLPVANDYQKRNVAAELADGQSTLNFYKTLLSLRRSRPALHNGAFTFVDGLGDDLLAYLREADGQRLMVCLNFGGQSRPIDLNHLSSSAETLLSTHFNAHSGTTFTLQPHESVLLQLK